MKNRIPKEQELALLKRLTRKFAVVRSCTANDAMYDILERQRRLETWVKDWSGECRQGDHKDSGEGECSGYRNQYLPTTKRPAIRCRCACHKTAA